MLKGLWTIGIKVADLEKEITFHQAVGNEIILDDEIEVTGKRYRIPLVKMGDKYIHIAEEMVYENLLDQPLPYGPVHLVYISNDFDIDVDQFISAGCRHIFEPQEISAGFGERKVAFMWTPNGWICEIAKIYKHHVPEVLAN